MDLYIATKGFIFVKCLLEVNLVAGLELPATWAS